MNYCFISRKFAFRRLILAAAVSLAAISTFAYTDGDWEYSYSDSTLTATVTKYNGSETSVTVPSQFQRTVSWQEKDDDGEWQTRHRTYTYTVTAIGAYAFQNKTFLKHATIPNTVTTLGSGLFSGCSSLETVTIPGNVKAIPVSCFNGCSSLSSVPIHSGITSIGSSAFRDCTGLRAVSLGPNITSLGESVFHGCDQITNAIVDCPVMLPNYLFANCSNLVSVVIGDNVTALEPYGDYHDSWKMKMHPFFHCPKISSFKIGRGITVIPSYYFGLYNSSDGGIIFPSCITLEHVELPDTLTTIDYNAFSGCGNVDFGDLSLPNLQSIGYSAFAGCGSASFANLSLPKLQTIGYSAFAGCSRLDAFAFPDTLTSIGASAFKDCTGLRAVSLGPNITSLGESVFHGCTSMTDVHLPETLEVIPGSCFLSCAALETVTIPERVATIVQSAFRYCTSLTNVWFEGSPPSVGYYVFANVAPNARGHYPRSLADKWLPRIDRNGKWNGLIMHELSQPVLRVKSASPIDGTITLAWDDGTDGQCVSSYSIYRSANDSYTEADRVATGITDTEWTDTNYWNAEPVLSPLNYWVVAESDYFDIPESNRVETRHRYGLAVGCNEYSPTQLDSKTLQQYAPVPANKTEAELFKSLFSKETHVLSGTNATIAKVKQELAVIAEKVHPGDLFAFFVSTHGGKTTVDEETGEERTAGLMLYDGDFTAGDVAEAVADIDAESRIVCVFSSCFAAHMTDMGAWASAAERERLARRGLTYCPLNVAWIGASSFEQLSVGFENQISEFGHYFLKRGWQDGYADAKTKGTDWPGGDTNGCVTLGELVEYTRDFSCGISDENPSAVFSRSSFDMDTVILAVGVPKVTAGTLSAPNNVWARVNESLLGAKVTWGAVDGAETYRVFRREEGASGAGECVAYGIDKDVLVLTNAPPSAGVWEYAVAAASDLAVGPLSPFSATPVNAYGTIVLYLNDSDIEGEGETRTIRVQIGKPYGLFLADHTPPLRTGYSFLGWHAVKDGKQVNPESIVRIEDADGLEAFWGRDDMDCTTTESLTSTEAKVTWATDANAVSYLLFRSETNDCLMATSIASVSAGTSFTDESVEEVGVYYYWVAPVTTTGVGPISAASTISIRPKTKASPIPVLHEWLDSYAVVENDDYEAAACATAANNVNKIWECYVAGCDPTDETAKFEARIEIGVDGKPIVSWQPDLNEDGTKAERVYRVLGAKSLGASAEWDDITDIADPDAEGYRFFKVSVELP